jgi:hypothetical protein
MSGKNAQSTQPFAVLGGAMSDSFELMRKAWGLAGLPTLPGTGPMAQFAAGLPSALPQMITSTLDVEEMDKRIADLKAVEQWLDLNMSMLRTTIQTLEVQRNTVATLKSYGGSMLQTMMGSIPGARANPDRDTIPASATAQVVVRAAAPAGPTVPAAAAAISRAPASKRSPASASVPDMALPMNPSAWWSSLQEQFAKIAGAAGAAASANEKKLGALPKSTRKRVRRRTAPR